MVFVPSAHLHQELVSVPQFIRFTIGGEGSGRAPHLIIKASMLDLKYLTRTGHLRLCFFTVSDKWLGYGAEIGDPGAPSVLWSLLEQDDEREAIETLSSNPSVGIALFNELVVSVAWTDTDLDLSDPRLTEMLKGSVKHRPDEPQPMNEVGQRIDELRDGTLPPRDGIVVPVPGPHRWTIANSVYLPNRGGASSLRLTDIDEGRQQEEIGLWLIDALGPAGAVKNPIIHEAPHPRELCDLLMSHSFGAFLFESKAFSLLGRATLPSRKKLAGDLQKDVRKAARQLKGAVKNARRGLKVTDQSGHEITIELHEPPHVIVLVPDLSLLDDATGMGGPFFREMLRECGGFFHVLDLKELFRVVQAAQMIASAGTKTTPLMAFDACLVKRFRIALTSKSPHFEVIVQMSPEAPPSTSLP